MKLLTMQLLYWVTYTVPQVCLGPGHNGMVCVLCAFVYDTVTVDENNIVIISSTKQPSFHMC